MFPPFPVLLPNPQLVRRIRELAAQIGRELRDPPPCLVAVVDGARTFARHLQQQLPGNLPVHEIRASSYGAGTQSSGRVEVTGGERIPVQGRTVLLLEDIVDTGRTIARLQQHFALSGAAAVRVATLLNKPSRRIVPVELHYVGFTIPDEFVLGFGMDLAGRYRELPDVVRYDPAVEAAFEQASTAR